MAIVLKCNGARERQSQACASRGAIAAAFAPLERLQHRGDLLRGNARAIIFDCNHRMPIVFCETNILINEAVDND